MTAPADEREERGSRDDLIEGYKELLGAREIYAEADAYYTGDVGATFASPRVQKMLERAGVEEIEDFRYAAIPVDAVADRLQIASVTAVPAEEEADEREGDEESAIVKKANKAIADLRKHNELDAEEKHLHHVVSVHGEAYMFVWPSTNDSGDVESVDMRVNTAHNVRMIYDREDELIPRYVIKSWEIEHQTSQGARVSVRANLYYADRIERWITDPGGKPEDPQSWRKLVDASDVDMDVDEVANDEFGDDDGDSGEDIPNPYGRVPWFHFRNDRPHGEPEHSRAYGPQQMINKLIGADGAVIDFQTFPQRYMLMDPMLPDVHTNYEDPDHPDTEEDDPETETGTSGLKADPGVVWRMWAKTVGQFEPADAEVFLKRFDRYIKAMAELTQLPQSAFSRASADMPSGEAVRELNADLYARVVDRQDRYDPVWEDSYEFALMMLGVEGVSVEVRWKPVQIVNDSSGWGVVGQKIQAGVPSRVALQETGYSKEMVEEWEKDLTGADMLHRVGILEKIATAAQALGMAVTAGVVSETTTQALFDRLLRLTAEGTSDPKPDEDSLPAPKFREPPPVNPAEAAAKAAQDFPAPPPKMAVDPDTGKVPPNPAMEALRMGGRPPTKTTSGRTPARRRP